ncbi:MAG: hypothetical protein ACT4NL_12035 [Pseudomarimonas sp.]
MDAAPRELAPGQARLAGLITDSAIAEVSGLAAANVHPGILWTHNDSGSSADIYAIDAQAKRRARVHIDNAANYDWEDMASFRDADRNWLLIADTGDNGGVRKELQLYFVPEPQTLSDGSASAARTLRFVWPDGARDCEAVGVDIKERMIYLIAKKRVPPELYRLPLDGDSTTAPLVAERVALLAHIAQPDTDDMQRNPVYGRYRAQISSMDISADGSKMAVLNYLHARIYTRLPSETWATAVMRKPVDVPFPWITQAEAIAFSTDASSVWIGSEILPAQLLQIPLFAP